MQTNLAAVATKQAFERLWLGGEISQRGLHRSCQLPKLGKILIVCGPLFGVAPEVLNRIVVWRVTGQLPHGQACPMCHKELPCGGTGVILGPILNEEEMLLGLRQHAQQELLIALAIEVALDALIEQATGKELNQPKDFVGAPHPTGLDLRCVPLPRSGVAQGIPLRKRGFVAKENQSLAPFGLAQQVGPDLAQPQAVPLLVEMIRDKLRFLKGVTQVLQ